MNKVWIVEMKNYENGRWEPCCTARLTKADAMLERKDWLKQCPDEHFRVKPYFSAPNVAVDRNRREGGSER